VHIGIDRGYTKCPGGQTENFFVSHAGNDDRNERIGEHETTLAQDQKDAKNEWPV
jgi:hypothetical protein